jgi:hypothetical protein
MACMGTQFLPWTLGELLLAAMVLSPAPVSIAAETASVATLFWCPGRSGNELQVKPGPGCHLLVEEKKDDETDEKAATNTDRQREVPTIGSDQIESAVSSYLKEYRNFLACCAAAPDMDEAAQLEERASDLLRQVTHQVSAASIYMSRNQALIVPVAQARDELRALQKKYGRITDSKAKLDGLSYEEAGQERRKIQDMEDSLGREFSPKRRPSRAPTGADIGGSGPTGPSVGGPAPTGTGIGKSGPTGTAIGTPPPTLGELVDTPPGADRNRESSLTTTQPVSGGTVGPDIGNSSFNENARTGPALGDSTQNR